MNLTKRLFGDGAAYETLMGQWSRRAGEVFLEWLGAPAGLTWLDAGCGTGAFTEELVARSSPARVTALDPSEDQLAFARMRLGLERVGFVAGDAQGLPFPNNSFDWVVMALVVHFLPDPLSAVREIARVLKPGGIAATYVWDHTTGGSPTSPLAFAMQSMGLSSPAPPSPNATSSAALRQICTSAELHSPATRQIRITVEFANFTDFWDSMTVPVGPAGTAIARLHPNDLDLLRITLKAQVPHNADGRVIYEARANALKARKANP